MDAVPDGLTDLRGRADLEVLLRRFYAAALADDLLGPVFAAAGTDVEAHLPRIADFWERVLLGTGRYDGRPLDVHRAVHAAVPLTDERFARWLDLWTATVRSVAAGPVADAAVEHARRTADGFRAALRPAPARSLPLVGGSSGPRPAS